MSFEDDAVFSEEKKVRKAKRFSPKTPDVSEADEESEVLEETDSDASTTSGNEMDIPEFCERGHHDDNNWLGPLSEHFAGYIKLHARRGRDSSDVTVLLPVLRCSENKSANTIDSTNTSTDPATVQNFSTANVQSLRYVRFNNHLRSAKDVRKEV